VQLSPNATIVARDLFVKATFESGRSPGSATFTLRANGANTGVACTITLPSAPPFSNLVKTCDSGAASATIPPGSALSIMFTVLDPANNNDLSLMPPISFGWRAANP
jgi:hypothetical protein